MNSIAEIQLVRWVDSVADAAAGFSATETTIGWQGTDSQADPCA